MRTIWWCAICFAAGACAWWEALRYVVPFIVFKFQEKQKENHDTLLCRAREQCGLAVSHFTMTAQEIAMNSVMSPDLSDEEAGKIYEHLDRRLASKGRNGTQPLVLHIGPADLDDEDMAMYNRLAAPLRDSHGKVAFVEPHPFLRSKLQQKLRSLPDGLGQLSPSVLPVAICPGDREAVLYKISDRFFRDFKETGWLYLIRYWAGLDRQHLLRELQIFCNQTGKVWLFKTLHVFPKTFPSTLDAWMPYIEELPVRCLSPRSILQEVQAGPESVEILIVDAEGYDTELVNLFLAMDRFAPSTIVFEWHLHANDPSKLDALVKLARGLHARGYDIHRHNHDVIAIAY